MPVFRRGPLAATIALGMGMLIAAAPARSAGTVV
jgi:hypothetical protein